MLIVEERGDVGRVVEQLVAMDIHYTLMIHSRYGTYCMSNKSCSFLFIETHCKNVHTSSVLQ